MIRVVIYKEIRCPVPCQLSHFSSHQRPPQEISNFRLVGSTAVVAFSSMYRLQTSQSRSVKCSAGIGCRRKVGAPSTSATRRQNCKCESLTRACWKAASLGASIRRYALCPTAVVELGLILYDRRTSSHFRKVAKGSSPECALTC
jgi:hypothetical protein